MSHKINQEVNNIPQKNNVRSAYKVDKINTKFNTKLTSQLWVNTQQSLQDGAVVIILLITKVK